VHGLPISGAAKRLEAFGKVRTNGARAVLGLGSRTTERGGSDLGNQRKLL
jgi:hypothetical protein